MATASVPGRTTGSQRATGYPRATGSQPATGYPRTTGSQPATGPSRSTGPLRTTGPMSRAGRSNMPRVVLGLIGLGAVAVLGLWWKDTPAIHTNGDLVTNAGRIMGLLAGYGFVVLVGLMARVPPLERGIGTDRLARWHAMGGRYVITLVTGHVLAITWGYALTAHEGVTHEAVTLLTSYPDVLYATIAWFLLLLIAGISARAVRGRVSYEAWYYVHLLTYASIALAFSHQFADGASFISDASARFAWSAIYAIVGGLILWYRFIVPLRMFARHRFTVMGVREEAPGVVSVYITGRDLDQMRAEPGQFFRWRFLTRQHLWQSHPYSLSAMPRPDMMRITVKARGHHSGSMAFLRPGTKVIAEGPYGAFTPSFSGRRVLLIAGGVGITPIRAMFAALPRRMNDGITLIYRASHPRDVVFRRELDAIAADRNAVVYYVIGSRAQLGYDPLDPIRLRAMVPGLQRYEAYVCGPSGMTETAIASLRDSGLRPRHIHHEDFDF
ncbi:MAG TPA: ferredoxin reductase family protein [Trebonia sp.]|nr:ferredoxin reductase family protein [Trebonia sp.]